MKAPLSIGIGFSKTGDAETAAREARDMAGEKITFAIVFSSSAYDANAVYTDISSVLPEANIIGCTTAGEICNLAGNTVSDSLAVLGIGGSRIRTSVGVGNSLSKRGEEAGVEAAASAYKTLNFDPYTLFVGMMHKTPLDLVKMKMFVNVIIPDGLSAGEENFLRGLVRVTGRHSPIIGGSSGDDLNLKKTWQFGNGVHTDAGVLGVITGGIKLGTAIGNSYVPIPDKGAAVTKSKGRVVYEFNHRPAADVLKELLGVDELTFEVNAQKPLGFKSVDVSNEYVIRSVRTENPDGGLSFFSEIPQGMYFNVMETNKKLLEERFRETLRKALSDAGNPKNVGAVVVFNCIYKHLANVRCGCNDFDIIWDEVGKEVPVIGFNTYGEQGSTSGGAVGHHNQTSSLLVIGNELVSQ
ncbi:MAG: FIST C-terminal domain-containing protein [Theionarchaea archaeon]|nr:FIST C-terminal domain-containing protein [Theionarchaea archaeon]